MNVATSTTKPSHRKIADEPHLRDMAVGLVRGEFKDPTNAAKAVLRAHGFNNDAHEESNVRRLTEKYREEHWHAKGLEEVIQQEIRIRGANGQPKTSDPSLHRHRAYSQLYGAIQEYIEYEEMVDGTACSLGMAYLLEDFLWDWYGHVSNGRESVELLVESVPIAIHLFYEGMMAKKNDWRDKDGIVANYPHTTVLFTVDPSKPLEPQRLKTTRVGKLETDSLQVTYKDPNVPDSRWLDAETKRFQEHSKKHGHHHLPVWRWPEAKPKQANDARFRIVDVVSDQDVPAASPAL